MKIIAFIYSFARIVKIPQFRSCLHCMRSGFFLIQIMERHLDTNAFHSLCRKLKKTPLQLQLYTPAFYQAACIVYCKVHIQGTYLYVGMTCQGMEEREATRRRKLRQVMRNKVVDAEPALYFWKHQQPLSKFINLVLVNCPCLSTAQTWESSLISQWQPNLNWPFLKLDSSFQQNPGRFHMGTAAYSLTGNRLWKKVRRKLKSSIKPMQARRAGTTLAQGKFGPARLAGWSILHRIAGRNRLSFTTNKLLRSKQLAVLDIYALHRLATQMAEPDRSRCKQILQGVMKFRHVNRPPRIHSLCIPHLAHPSFFRTVKSFLKSLLCQHRGSLIPFHLPPTTVIARSNTSIGHAAHN